jgi:hypothetical protein
MAHKAPQQHNWCLVIILENGTKMEARTTAPNAERADDNIYAEYGDDITILTTERDD